MPDKQTEINWQTEITTAWRRVPARPRKSDQGIHLERARDHAENLLSIFDEVIVDPGDQTPTERTDWLYEGAALALEAAASIDTEISAGRAKQQPELLQGIARRFTHWRVGPFDTAASDYWKTALSMHLTSARAVLNDLEDDSLDANKTLRSCCTSLAADAVAAALLATPGPNRRPNLTAELEGLETEVMEEAADIAQHDPSYPTVGKNLSEAIVAAVRGLEHAKALSTATAQEDNLPETELVQVRSYLLRAAACELLEIETLDVEREDPAYSGQRTIMTAALAQAAHRIAWMPLISSLHPFNIAEGCLHKAIDLAGIFHWVCRGLKGDEEALRWVESESVRQLGNSMMALWAIDYLLIS